jgi:hypothetical protein
MGEKIMNEAVNEVVKIKRPKGITVIGILCMLGALAYIPVLVNYYFFPADSSQPQYINFYKLLYADASNILLKIALFIVAIGILKARNWARFLLIAGCVYSVFNFGLRIAGDMVGLGAVAHDTPMLYLLTLVVYGLKIAVFCLFLIYLNLPKVKECFK